MRMCSSLLCYFDNGCAVISGILEMDKGLINLMARETGTKVHAGSNCKQLRIVMLPDLEQIITLVECRITLYRLVYEHA